MILNEKKITEACVVLKISSYDMQWPNEQCSRSSKNGCGTLVVEDEVLFFQTRSKGGKKNYYCEKRSSGRMETDVLKSIVIDAFVTHALGFEQIDVDGDSKIPKLVENINRCFKGYQMKLGNVCVI